MNKGNSVPWESLPTVVELTEDGARKKQIASKMAEMLDDDLDTGGESHAASGSGGRDMSIENFVRDFNFGGDEVPTIVASAAPLLNLAHAIRHSDDQPNIEELRRTTMDAINRYERDLASARISPDRARAAHYVVCATVDDVVLSKPWGVRAGWARSGLVSTFHMDVTGGERVFDLLEHFQKSPGTNKDLLLLIYLSLSLAFEGRTRVSPRGGLELGRMRDNLYKILLGQYGVFERELSPNWRGVAARHEPLRTLTALWTLLALLALLFALGYLFFTLSLGRVSDDTFVALGNLPPRTTPTVAIRQGPEIGVVRGAMPFGPDSPKQPQIIATPRQPTRVQRLLTFLKPEVERKLVTLSSDKGRILVRVNNTGMFDVGSADVRPEFRALFERIGAALATNDFSARVIGYTDNTPIHTAQFPSNYDLSLRRAEAVSAILEQFVGKGSVETIGQGEGSPIAPNTNEQGRQLNRRTEILVLGGPDDKINTPDGQPISIVIGPDGKPIAVPTPAGTDVGGSPQ